MHYYPQLFDVFLLWNRLIIYKGIQLITYIRLMFHMSNTSLFNLEKFSSTDDWVDRKENGMHGMVWPEPEQVMFFFFFYLLCAAFFCSSCMSDQSQNMSESNMRQFIFRICKITSNTNVSETECTVNGIVTGSLLLFIQYSLNYIQ